MNDLGFLSGLIAILISSNREYSLELKPLYDRTIINNLTGLDAIFSKQWQDLDCGPNNRSLMLWEFKEVASHSVRGTFHLTRARIEKLRQLVKVEMAKTNYEVQLVQSSTFCLACSYIWVCLIKSGEINDNDMILGFPVDYRPRLEPPMPETYFGNCLGGKIVVADAKRLVGKDGLVVAIKAIGEAIKSFDIGSMLDGAESWVSRCIGSSSSRRSEPEVRGTRVYTVVGSPRCEVYSSDFEWGRPRKIDVVSIDRTRAISLSETRNGDGVRIGLVLEKHHMEAFASLFTQAF